MHQFRTVLILSALLTLFLGMTAAAAYAEDIVYLPLISYADNGAAGPAISDVTAADRVMDDQADAAANGYPWRGHRKPFDFMFGNNIDNHQQSKTEGQDRLTGFLYIEFDPVKEHDGLPVARHAPCDDPTSSCTVGWGIQGIMATAKLMRHGQGQPLWCIAEEDRPAMQGYSHFHWVRSDSESDTEDGYCEGLGNADWCKGYLIKLTAHETFWFKHAGHGSGQGGPPSEEPGNGGCDGHDGEPDEGGCSGHDGKGGQGNGAAVYPGIDTSSHDNFFYSTDCETAELPEQ